MGGWLVLVWSLSNHCKVICYIVNSDFNFVLLTHSLYNIYKNTCICIYALKCNYDVDDDGDVACVDYGRGWASVNEAITIFIHSHYWCMLLALFQKTTFSWHILICRIHIKNYMSQTQNSIWVSVISNNSQSAPKRACILCVNSVNKLSILQWILIKKIFFLCCLQTFWISTPFISRVNVKTL